MSRITEKDSLYHNLEQKSVAELLKEINQEDQKVALAIQTVLPKIEEVVSTILPRMQAGGRLFYIGAGTSGRLGILDASECPPTFGVSHELVIGLIAGGDAAIRKAVEKAEDDLQGAWTDLLQHDIKENDSVIGIAASGTTPYVLGGLQLANANDIYTACICCCKNSVIGKEAKTAIEVEVGPEYITGSTRMKSGTAQKMVLNMISSALMIRLGRVKGNKMVDMQLSNNKLIDRAIRMIQAEHPSMSKEEAQALLDTHGNVRSVLSFLS